MIFIGKSTTTRGHFLCANLFVCFTVRVYGEIIRRLENLKRAKTKAQIKVYLIGADFVATCNLASSDGDIKEICRPTISDWARARYLILAC